MGEYQIEPPPPAQRIQIGRLPVHAEEGRVGDSQIRRPAFRSGDHPVGYVAACGLPEQRRQRQRIDSGAAADIQRGHTAVQRDAAGDLLQEGAALQRRKLLPAETAGPLIPEGPRRFPAVCFRVPPDALQCLKIHVPFNLCSVSGLDDDHFPAVQVPDFHADAVHGLQRFPGDDLRPAAGVYLLIL